MIPEKIIDVSQFSPDEIEQIMKNRNLTGDAVIGTLTAMSLSNDAPSTVNIRTLHLNGLRKLLKREVHYTKSK